MFDNVLSCLFDEALEARLQKYLKMYPENTQEQLLDYLASTEDAHLVEVRNKVIHWLKTNRLAISTYTRFQSLERYRRLKAIL